MTKEILMKKSIDGLIESYLALETKYNELKAKYNEVKDNAPSKEVKDKTIRLHRSSHHAVG